MLRISLLDIMRKVVFYCMKCVQTCKGVVWREGWTTVKFQVPGGQTNFEGLLEKISIPQKVLIFGWKMMNNRLATQDNKRRCSIIVSTACEVCGMEEESVTHTLVRCGHTVTLRAAMRQLWNWPDQEQFLRLTPDSFFSNWCAGHWRGSEAIAVTMEYVAGKK